MLDFIFKKEETLTWYMFVFTGTNLEGNSNCQASTYAGCDDGAITLRIINDQKKLAGMSNNCVCTNIVNLGLMTQTEFEY